MTNAVIDYKIRINEGKKQHQLVEFSIDLEDLEIDDLSQILIDKGHLEYWCNNDEFTILSREITIINN